MHKPVLCFLHCTSYRHTHWWAVTWLLHHCQRDTDQPSNMGWVKFFRWTSPVHQSSFVLALNWAYLWTDGNDSMSEMCSPHLSPLWQKLVLKITHSLVHKVVCWGMNEYFLTFCNWDTVALWDCLVREVVLISCSLHDPEHILSGLTQWNLITSVS